MCVCACLIKVQLAKTFKRKFFRKSYASLHLHVLCVRHIKSYISALNLEITGTGNRNLCFNFLDSGALFLSAPINSDQTLNIY